jgi:glucokinase
MGPLAGSAREGVLDDVASRTAIAGDAAALAARHGAPNLKALVGTDVGRIRSSDLATAIAKGDRGIEKLVRSRARVVGIALSNLVDFINPEVLVLGGGLVEAMPGLVRNEVRKGIEAHSTRPAFKALKVRASKLGDHAVTAGAARLACDSLEGPV